MVQTSGLLQLPGELRNQIVEHAFHRALGTCPPPLHESPLAFASTCRQLYEEYHTLAMSVTIHKVQWQSAQQLRNKASSLSEFSKASIRKLQIVLPLNLEDLYVSQTRRTRVKGFGIAAAGVIGIEELYIQYRSEHNETGVGLLGRETLMLIVWSLLWEGGMENLTKVCAVHHGTQPFLCPTIMNGNFRNFGPCVRSKRWRLVPEVDCGQLRFVGERRADLLQRDLRLLMGYSFREAETYFAVRKQLIRVRSHAYPYTR